MIDSQLKEMLEEWLASGTEIQKRHAAHRLGMPDAAGHVPGAPQVPTKLKAIPPIVNMDPWLMKIRACEHYQPGCCAHPAPYCDRFNINPSRDKCIGCLGGNPE